MASAGNPDKRLADLQKRVRALQEQVTDLMLWKTAYLDSVKEQGIPLGFEFDMRSSYDKIHTVLKLKRLWDGADGKAWKKHMGGPDDDDEVEAGLREFLNLF